MNLQRAALHRIIKKQYEKDVELKTRDQELPITEAVINLVDEVHQRYGSRIGKVFGRFEDEGENHEEGPTFRRLVCDYIKDRRSFIEFSIDATHYLAELMREVNLAAGGYLMFADFSLHSHRYLLVVMLSDKIGKAIDDRMEVVDLIHLDLETLHVAGRLDMAIWDDPDNRQHYLSFISGRSSSEGVSGYFRKFLGCELAIKPKEETKALIQSIHQFASSQHLQGDERSHFLDRVYDYCQEKAKSGDPLFLEDFSAYINENDKQEFLSFLEKRNIQLNNGFQPHPVELRRLKRFEGKLKSMRLSFESDVWGTLIKRTEDKKGLIITEIPEELRQQLDEYDGERE